MIKESSQEEDIPITNIYTSNIRKMLTAIKGEIDSNTIIVGDFNTPLTPMEKVNVGGALCTMGSA